MKNQKENEMENSSRFESLKNRIYTLYMQTCKAQLLSRDLSNIQEEFDTLVASVCVHHMENEISMVEFNTLCVYLIKMYAVYKMGV